MQRIGQEHAGKIKEKNEITALLASKMKIDHSKPPHSPMFSYKWTVALLGFLSVQRIRFGCWDECCYISFEWYVDSKKIRLLLAYPVALFISKVNYVSGSLLSIENMHILFLILTFYSSGNT